MVIIHATVIITHPQDKLIAVTSTVSLTCTSSLSSNVIFSWSHNGKFINGSSTTGDTSILTITRVRHSDVGSYVCTVRSGSLSVMSNTTTLTVYGKICVCVWLFYELYNLSLFRCTSDYRSSNW